MLVLRPLRHVLQLQQKTALKGAAVKALCKPDGSREGNPPCTESTHKHSKPFGSPCLRHGYQPTLMALQSQHSFIPFSAFTKLLRCQTGAVGDAGLTAKVK